MSAIISLQLKLRGKSHDQSYTISSQFHRILARRRKRVYADLTTDRPIDLTRYQVLNCYAGRMGLINSGGASEKTEFPVAKLFSVPLKKA